jgi:hypothetical protein
MSTLDVTNIQTVNGTTDLVLKTGNTTGPQIVVSANGRSITLRGNSSSNSVFINTTAVYVNGTIPSSNILTLTATGSVVISGNVTPTIITSNTTAWNPGTSNVYVIRLEANAAGTANNTNLYEAYISGLTAGTNGQVLILSNIGSQKIQLRNEDSANETTAGNRFSLPNHVWLSGFQSMKIIYDGTLARWRPMNSLLIEMDHKYSLTKGFFAGGTTPTVVATADRTTYSSETTVAVAGANLSQARYILGAAGNADKGFFSGGYTSVAVATADRTTYSSETTAAVAGANLSQARYSPGGAGNADKGFFSGGFGPTVVATADRTTYSSETTAAVAGANLSQARYALAAAGNADKGFFSGGGIDIFSTPATTTDRTTYSTETTAAVAGANLSQARYTLGAAGNADKGFFSGGGTPSVLATTTDRTTYSSETTAAVAGANLSQARNALAAAGNVDKGFFSGGSNPTIVATADRTTYSTETTAAVAGANLSQARSGPAAV